jgi:hypothetical protein
MRKRIAKELKYFDEQNGNIRSSTDVLHAPLLGLPHAIAVSRMSAPESVVQFGWKHLGYGKNKKCVGKSIRRCRSIRLIILRKH